MKASAIVLLLLIVLPAFTVFISKASVQASGLVGYWNFNEGSGNIAADSSGNGNNGTLTNSPAWVAGINGTALSFDGVDNNVVVPDSSSLDLSSAVTVMAWVYLPVGAHYGESRILGKDASNGGSNLDLDISDDSGHVSFDLGHGSGFTGPILVSSGYVPRQVWTHVAATYDGSLAKIYINGVLSSSISWTSGFNTNNGMPLCIGSKNYLGALGGSLYQFFINATIDDVRIYNTALSQQEIQELYPPVAPIIGTVTQVPATDNVNDSQSVTVSANVTDVSYSLHNVTLVYSTDDYATNNTVLMQLNATTGLYGGVIVGYTRGTTVNYAIEAFDNVGNFAEMGQTPYTVVPEFQSFALLIMMMAILAAAVLIARKKRIR